MKKGLIISREYTPMSNGSITCLENILNELKEKYNLTVISYKYANNYQEKEVINGIEVRRFSSKFDQPTKARVAFLDKKKFSKIKWAQLTKPLYLPFYVFSRMNGLFFSSAWEKNISKNIEKSMRIEDYDFVLAMGAPFENIRAAEQISNKYNLPLYILEFDLFTYNPTHDLQNESVLNKNLEEELKWYEHAAHIFITKEMGSTVMNSRLSKYEDKITAINMPNFIPVENNLIKMDTEDINVLYAGMFYEDIRNPKHMLKVFSSVFNKTPEIKLHIMGFGCEDIVESYRKMWPNNIFVHGKQPKSRVVEMTREAHFLLNLSNKTSSQAPSKIIEYVSTGKPIINFFTIDNDLCVEVLEKYELSISLDERKDINIIENELVDFIQKNKYSVANSEVLFEEFFEYSPTFVANQISSTIGE